jgi:hypothetical protein
MTTLLEITLSDWTPSITRYSFHYVRIYETAGKIVLSLRKQLPKTKHAIQMPEKVLSNHQFTPLELEMLKLNLEMMLKSSQSFVPCFAPLGYEYDLEKYILGFEVFSKEYRRETRQKIDEENNHFISELQEENKWLQKDLKQLQRNYKTYKYEFNEFMLDYHRLTDHNKHIELIARNIELEDLFQKEKFEKEQFMTYCNNLNEKLMELTDE